MTEDGFGRTWLTNWKRASEVPGRVVVSAFLAGLGVGLVDYYATSYRNVGVSVVIGIGCALILTLFVIRKLRSYRDA